MTLTSPASQDRLPVNDTIEYVEIAILQSVDSKIGPMKCLCTMQEV